MALQPSVMTRHFDGSSVYSEQQRPVDWKLVAENFDEMLRTAISIKTGKLAPSTILRRLGSYNRRNRLNQAFHELGRVVRTEFLLNWISDMDLRRVTLGAMNKSEQFNRFSK